jgi:uncharacterized protein (DUF1330 family)
MTMKTALTVAVSMLTGIALGGIGVHALHAQAKPPAYFVAMNEVTDQDGFRKNYVPDALASVKAHGGKTVAAGQGTVVSGNLPTGRVVVEVFGSLDQLMTWWHSPEYQATQKIGEKYAKFNQVAVEGIQ